MIIKDKKCEHDWVERICFGTPGTITECRICGATSLIVIVSKNFAKNSKSYEK